MSKKLTHEQRDFLKLIKRSMYGSGWAEVVMEGLWTLTRKHGRDLPELIELHESEHRVRLTSEGMIVEKWL